MASSRSSANCTVVGMQKKGVGGIGGVLPIGPNWGASYWPEQDLCAQHWAKCWKDGLMDIVEEKVGLKEVRNLQFGRVLGPQGLQYII